MIVTIDGPAGAGKSSVAKELARRLGFAFLDTGAMYRAVCWAGLEAGVELADGKALLGVAKQIQIEFQDDLICVDGKNVDEFLRTQRVSDKVKHAAGNSEVRAILVDQQRLIAKSHDNLVTEGRDQGTVVFPNAECKIFLTATPEERAKRRYRQLIAKGERVTFADVLDSQSQRDASDEQRSVAPLAKADDAVEFYTDEMTEEEVLAQLQWIVESCR